MYGASSIVAPGPDDPALPRHGSVAPDVALPGGGRLRDRLGRGYALVVSGTLPVAGADVIGVGSGGPFGSGRAWLVRPDGYLADSAALEDATAVERLVRAATS